jgi:hypothetical protein
MDPLPVQPPLGGRWLLPFGDAVIRFLATYLLFLGAWFVAAGALGALDPERAGDPRQVWRPAVGALLAAPLGAVLRGAWRFSAPSLGRCRSLASSSGGRPTFSFAGALPSRRLLEKARSHLTPRPLPEQPVRPLR